MAGVGESGDVGTPTEVRWRGPAVTHAIREAAAFGWAEGRWGEGAAGDPVEVVHRPGHGLTVAEVSRIYHDDHAGAARLLEVPELADSWRRWARRFAAAAAGGT